MRNGNIVVGWWLIVQRRRGELVTPIQEWFFVGWLKGTIDNVQGLLNVNTFKEKGRGEWKV